MNEASAAAKFIRVGRPMTETKLPQKMDSTKAPAKRGERSDPRIIREYVHRVGGLGLEGYDCRSGLQVPYHFACPAFLPLAGPNLLHLTVRSSTYTSTWGRSM
jgi:hypothetical protein